MDHLPLPSTSCEADRCAYVPNSYGVLEKSATFSDHELHAGPRMLNILRAQKAEQATKEQLEGFFQSWLFFSLIREVLSPSITSEALVQVDGSATYLYTRSLNGYIHNWHVNQEMLNEHDRQARKRHAATSLRNATFILNWHTTSFEMQMMEAPFFSNELDLVLRCLVQTLEFGLLPDDLPRQRVIDDHGTQICQMLIRRLLHNRWCPNQVSMLAHTLDVPSLYFVSLLGQDFSGRQHDDCSAAFCVANQIDDTRYETRHTKDGCKCSFQGAPLPELAVMVENGHIPLISTSDQRPAIQQQLDEIPYVAISHVWADGLGNPNANQLPICQLQRLGKLVKSILPESGLFWCDTLCVPVKPPGLRRKAIMRMRDIYENAHTVLVLDMSMSSISSKISDEELLIRLTCSQWNRRLWTFQEKILARNLTVLLGGEIVNIDQAHKRVLTYTRHPRTGLMSAASYHSSLALEASAFYRTRLPSQKRLQESEAARKIVNLASVWESVQWRMTSWKTDEPVCLATALALDLEHILATPEDKRMQALFSQLDGFPPYLIFASFERMSAIGWRWAPITLMQPGVMAASKMHHMNSITRWSPEGLIVEFPGFVADMSDLKMKDWPAKLSTVDVEKLWEMKARESGRWYFCHRIDLELSDDFVDPYEHRLRNLRNPAVILSCPLEALHEDPQAWDGLLVDVDREVDRIVYCAYVARVSVGMLSAEMWSDTDDELARSGYVTDMGKENLPMLSKAFCGIRSSTQKWCVG